MCIPIVPSQLAQKAIPGTMENYRASYRRKDATVAGRRLEH